DTTFGSGGGGHLGYSELTFGTTGNAPTEQFFDAIAIDRAGNLIAVGSNDGNTTATLARFTSTGAVDTGFGTSGRVAPTLVPGGISQELTEVALDGDGQLVAAGYVNSGGSLIAVTRYSADGIIDADFGTAGVGTTPAAGLEPRMLVQPDGRIVALGAS